MHNLLDASYLVKDFGYLGIFLAIFLESGVIFGFFLPGDSLLFTAGLLASQGYLDLYGLIVISIAAAILGNNVGYYTGKNLGHTLFTKKHSFFFSPKRVEEAHEFFGKRGGKSLILARFIPAIRTFAPIAAGIGEMRYKKFLIFNATGALLWGILLPVLGYTLGKSVPNIDKYLLPIILVVVFISATPVIYSYLRSQRNRK